MELRHVSEMVAIKVKVNVILKTFWRPNSGHNIDIILGRLE